MYEQNIKSLKEEHDNFAKSLCIDDEKKTPQEKSALEKQKSGSEYTTIALMEAEKLWLAVKIAVMNNTFADMSDEQKVETVCKDFSDFHNNFPIVVKYMVCMGQYNQECFKKFLKLCDRTLSNAPVEREKNYMEEQWIICQASYVKYLWEIMQKKRYSRKDADAIFQQAYKSLKNDFKKFKEMHKLAEERVKNDEHRHKIQLLKEAASRITSGIQELDLESMRALVDTLKNKKYDQSYKRVIVQLSDVLKAVPPSFIARGTNEQAQQEYAEELQQSERKKKYKKMNIGGAGMLGAPSI
jgi:hypothetical protein